MAYVPYKGGTLLIPTGNSGYHLFVILTDRCAAGQHLLANFTSVPDTGAYDQTCLINPGEHPFVKHPSYVMYRLAEVQLAVRLTKMVNSMFYRVGDDADAALVAKMRAGIPVSLFTRQFVIQYNNTAPP